MSTGLQLLLDNTTLHRLYFAVDPASAPVDDREVANILHLIECLILAEQVTVGQFESAGSQERSDQILEWLENSENRGLIRVSPHSGEARQLDLAEAVASEMLERGLLIPTANGKGDLQEIDVGTGRPRGVVERASEFWRETSPMASISEIQLRATEEVAKYRTDGLFAYGIAQHEDLVSRISHAYKTGRHPGKEQWDRMHVVFRALFNQQLADRHDGQSYAPPPVRAKVLRNVYFQTIKHLRGTLSDVALGLHSEMGNPEFAEELLQAADDPLPLLGLAYMLQAEAMEGPTAPFEHRLLAARELAAPMRSRLSRLEELAKSDSSRYFRELRFEAQMLEEASRSRLGLQKSDGLGFQIDIGVMVDPTTGTPSVKVGVGGRSISDVRAMLKGGLGRKRVSVLSDGLVHTVQHRNIADAVRQVAR